MKKTILVLLCFIPFGLHANPGSWMPESKLISQIIVDNGVANALVVIQGGVPSAYIPSGCSSGYNTLYLDTDKGRAIFALAMSAYLAEKPVKLALACTTDGSGRPLITHILI